MRIKLQTENGDIYTIKRDDGERFIASRVHLSRRHADDPSDLDRWEVRPEGHMEARKRFKNLHEALNHVIDGWWPAGDA